MQQTPSEQLAVLFGQMMALIHSRFAGDSLTILHETGMTLPQLVGLQVLHHAGPVSVSMLSAALKLSASATSHLVDRMVEKGFVARTEDPEDRRQKRLEITETGRSLVERLQASRTAEFTTAFSEVNPEFQSQLVPIFEQLNAELARNHPLSQDSRCPPLLKSPTS